MRELSIKHYFSKSQYDFPISRISDFPSGSVHLLLDGVPLEQDAPERIDSGGKPCVLRLVGLEVPRIATAHSVLHVLCWNVDG